MKELSVCFTGHRDIPVHEVPGLKRTLAWMVEQCIVLGYVNFYCGGARGFDMLAGFTVLALKDVYPQVKLVMVLPCGNQAEKWDAVDRERYAELLRRADLTVCLSETYFDGCMRQRNQYLVDHSRVCLAYMTRPRSGAGQTMGMAKRAGLVIHNLAGVVPPDIDFPRG